MIFSSLTFLFAFLPVVFILYFLVNDKLKNFVLLLTSLFFYAWGEPKYIFLMLGSIVVNYIFGLKVSSDNKKEQKLWLTLSVIFNISLLVIFKYSNFFVDNFNALFNSHISIPTIALPLGISFFTFQTMSYVIDVYRKDGRVQRNIFDLALYVSLFPQLVAGPIVRYQTVDEQISKRIYSNEKFAVGVNRFICGLAKKVILANQLGMVADGVFSANIANLSIAESWLGIICYTLQIYFDFSGYSDMAIGLGKIFGFDFLENFNYPYISQSVSEFWRRWHISLSSWFRDYVYIPLGGNRVSPIKQYTNLFVVWSLTGIWHGANWTFLTWGIYYGILISIEKVFLGKLLKKVPQIFRHIYLILIVMIGWVFFRADNIVQASEFVQVLFGVGSSPICNNSFIMYINDYGYIIILSIIFAIPIIPKLKSILKSKTKKLVESNFVYMLHSTFLVALMFIVVVILINSTYNPFLYFRF
ncbi:MBOAT family O-acyltransferase [Clostridioides difficile]|uniref:MBOAT family protein n=3 Tax=Clostridioides difficile TaxID=1496 RepID=A0A9P3WSZ6_CLODI|nr:MBOAT family O-acyltransferase [Clostridioides difficile]EHJ33748.1 alginate O-acetyltransferase AlgI family protein [Clostridioides difficile 002-P50-2011]EQG16044.1 MBOAT, membrane-bound O-acyltransferase family protein [Clostridioides difficile DA00065]EQK18536.1 MBOAT, membrane-bound O-acyltransferase family protein [Clostridioides difficile P71]EQK25574.1 MBOAT, membrane-bound O-acyltransferase family protein [Clostridioides difficile P74]AWH79237.1 MBOAT family protein [Clostridioides